MIPVDYRFYTEEYDGSLIPEPALKKMIMKANTYLSNLMHQSPEEKNLELVQFCLCEIAEMIYQDEQNRIKYGGREVQSESTDGYSVTYATEAEAGKIAVNSLQTKIYAVIRRYLASTGLLYAGVRCGAYKCDDYDI